MSAQQSSWIRVVVVVLLAMWIADSQAQPPGGRGGMRGRWGGGPGPDGGGMRGMPGRGGPGGMRGMPGGGPGGMRGAPPGGGFGDPMFFLRRLDTNGNGMLEPNETQGRARFFLDRVSQEADLDLSKPVPLDSVAQAFTRMRERRERESDGRDRGRGRESSRGRDRGGPSARQEADELEPLVPTFGEPQLFDPVPGFGTLGERYAVDIEESDRQEAQRTLGRYDRNNDGILTGDEMSRARWRDDPLKTDRNRDGKLTLNELALRYAMRRAERDGDDDNSSSRRSTSSRAGSRDSRGGGDNSRVEMFVRMMMSRYDRNRNGVLEQEEYSGMRGNAQEADSNRDRKITSDELTKWMASRMSGGRSRGGDDRRSGWFSRDGDRDRRSRGGSDEGEASSSSDGAVAQDGFRYRLRSATELMPDDLPEWYAQRDANADGQIMMHEFATSWSDRVVADFRQFDLNRDGIITVSECKRATEAGAVLGSPSATLVASASAGSGRYSSAGGSSGSSSGSTSRSSSSATPSTGTGSSAETSGGSSVSARYVKYAVGYIKRYDDDKNGVLTEQEWKKMSRDYSAADTDKDGKITPVELAEAMMKR